MANKKMIALTLILGLMAVATGCSDNKNPITVAPDTAPPSPPSELAVALDGGVAVVSWAPNTVDGDLAGYVVTRESHGEVDVLVGTPTLMTSYQDDAPVPGSSYYFVYAVDTSGNESAVMRTLLRLTGTRGDDMSAQ
ncbi:fibronectin type III domain-containing protein [bacterium]|nr:fibronectin type III domain-containing protein [bacterium]